MVDQDAIRRHLDDYEAIFRHRPKRFVCPITLREVEDSELIYGHILNESLKRASRRRVVQYSSIDHFYGTRLESGLVRYLNLSHVSRADLLRETRSLTVEFEDGSTAEAFITTGRAARAAAKRFPLVHADCGEDQVGVFVRTAKDDARLDRPLKLAATHEFLPAHWVGALVKAAFLTMFDLCGYRVIQFAWSNQIRSTLATYYGANGSRAQAITSFKDFEHSVRLLGRGRVPRDLLANYQPIEFDTLDDRVVLVNCAGQSQQLIFAITVIFQINGRTVTVTLPDSTAGTDPGTVWRLYQRYMADESAVAHTVHRMRFVDNRCEFETTPMRVSYPTDDELRDASL